MADVTLRQRNRSHAAQHVPEVKGIVDITDHTAGSNPTSPPRKVRAQHLRPYSPRLLLLCADRHVSHGRVRRSGPPLGVDVTVASERRAPSSGPTPPASSPWISPTRRMRRAGAGVRVRASPDASWRWTTTPPCRRCHRTGARLRGNSSRPPRRRATSISSGKCSPRRVWPCPGSSCAPSGGPGAAGARAY